MIEPFFFSAAIGGTSFRYQEDIEGGNSGDREQLYPSITPGLTMPCRFDHYSAVRARCQLRDLPELGGRKG